MLEVWNFIRFFTSSECGDWSLSLLPMMMGIDCFEYDRETRSTPTFRRKRFARRGEVGVDVRISMCNGERER